MQAQPRSSTGASANMDPCGVAPTDLRCSSEVGRRQQEQRRSAAPGDSSSLPVSCAPRTAHGSWQQLQLAVELAANRCRAVSRAARVPPAAAPRLESCRRRWPTSSAPPRRASAALWVEGRATLHPLCWVFPTTIYMATLCLIYYYRTYIIFGLAQ